MAVTFTLDYSTDIGKVRSLIGDTDPDNVFLDDRDIQVILGMQSALLLAAAQALEVMASKHANITKKIQSLDLQVDGAAVAAELRQLAKSYREQYRVGDSAYDPGFEIAEVINTASAFRNKIWNSLLTEG